MCGLAGIFATNLNISDLESTVRNMATRLQHRGPDSEGFYSDRRSLVLGHRRLAIIDPEHGQQPFITEDKRFIIVFNGAIYNYLELRRELISLGHPIHSYSDTEVIPYAYAEWGVDCLTRFRGMFAFALWDNVSQSLFCARDRVGIKPFYYADSPTQFIFASEIKGILASGMVHSELNQVGLQDYITFQFCLGEETLFSGIKKLEPGHYILIKKQYDTLQYTHTQYWDIDFTPVDIKTESEYVNELIALLDDSIRLHLRSDVPLGAHLSGGLDSSAVVCFASQMLEGITFKTFTGAFSEGKQYDETVYAKLVANHANSQYLETFIPSKEFSTILPSLIYYMDEPAAGPGLIPQYYVSKLAAEHVKVVLGGQGGDELLMGYARYFIAHLETCLSDAIFNSQSGSSSLQAIAPNLSLLKNYKPMLRYFFSEGLFDNDDARYFRLINRNEDAKGLFQPDVFKNQQTFERFQAIFNRKGLDSMMNKMSYFDLKTSLTSLLQVEDRTSMAVSIESRVPLLDHKLVEFIANIPSDIKFSQGKTKYLFREAIKNTIPPAIFNRQDKIGFPVPINEWMQGKDKAFVFDTLLSQKARERGIYDIATIEKRLSEPSQFSRVVWGLLCLELWFNQFIDKAVG